MRHPFPAASRGGDFARQSKPVKGFAHITKGWLILSACLFSEMAVGAEVPVDPTSDPLAPEKVEAGGAKAKETPAAEEVVKVPETKDGIIVTEAAKDAIKVPEGDADAAKTPEASTVSEGAKKDSSGVQSGSKSTRRLLTLEELMDTKIVSSASLTEIEPRKAPAQLTIITREYIATSGARDLVELLNIYVPGYQVNNHGSRGRVAGTRGIDSPVKSIILVDGVKVNDSWALGMLAETYLPMLGDIESVEYINGPGSAIYGAGAIGGVINIKTRRPDSLIAEGENQGGAVRVSHDFVSRSDWMELQYAYRLSDYAALSVYYGINQYTGLRDYDKDFHNQSVYFGVPPGGRSDPATLVDVYDKPINHKFMAQLDADEFKSSLRYTEAGYNMYPNVGVSYSQWNWHTQWSHEIADNLTLKLESNLMRGMGSQDGRNVLTGDVTHGNTRAWTHEIMTRGTVTYDINANHKFAVGAELIWDWYRPTNDIIATQVKPPATHNFTKSLFAEYQWKVLESVTLIAGGRMDFDRYTEDGYSPRAALVWTPTHDDTIKLIYSESFRDVVAQQFFVGASTHKDEHIRNYEILYNRRLGSHWSLDLGTYYNEAEYIGVIPAGYYGIIGDSRGYGASAAISYEDEGLRFGLSQNYDEVSSFTGLANPIFTQVPGRDVKYSTLSPHSSKLFAWVKISEQLSVDGNIQARWKYDGWQNRYDNQTATFKQTFNGKFGPFFAINLGTTWKFNKNFSVRADVYNVVGLFNRDLNRTLTYDSLNYYTMPTAVAVSCEYKF
jgi:outer membrane receptor for ferrienterochelin and colicin